MSTFEHVRRFWLGFDEIHRVLRPDGVFVVASPFYFHVHAYPNDYWRFTPEALDFLLDAYPERLLGWDGPDAAHGERLGRRVPRGGPPTGVRRSGAVSASPGGLRAGASPVAPSPAL